MIYHLGWSPIYICTVGGVKRRVPIGPEKVRMYYLKNKNPLEGQGLYEALNSACNLTYIGLASNCHIRQRVREHRLAVDRGLKTMYYTSKKSRLDTISISTQVKYWLLRYRYRNVPQEMLLKLKKMGCCEQMIQRPATSILEAGTLRLQHRSDTTNRQADQWTDTTLTA